jgi:hypothetical protein
MLSTRFFHAETSEELKFENYIELKLGNIELILGKLEEAYRQIDQIAVEFLKLTDERNKKSAKRIKSRYSYDVIYDKHDIIIKDEK